MLEVDKMSGMDGSPFDGTRALPSQFAPLVLNVWEVGAEADRGHAISCSVVVEWVGVQGKKTVMLEKGNMLPSIQRQPKVDFTPSAVYSQL